MRSAVLAVTYGVTLAVFPSVTAATCSASSATATSPCEPHPPAGRLYGAIPGFFVLATLFWPCLQSIPTVAAPK